MIKLCQNCGQRPSSMVFEMIVCGEKKPLCLCKICAQKLGLIESEKNGEAYERVLFERSSTKKKCPTCGTTEDAFLDTGFVGCPDCYYVFDSIVNVAEKWHGKVKHLGKTSPSRVWSKTRLDALMLKMRAALEQGDLKEVAGLKKEILGVKSAKK